MPGGFNGTYLETVGMEFESTALPRDFVEGVVLPHLSRIVGDLPRGIAITHDASTEFNAYVYQTPSGNLLVSSHTPLGQKFFQGNSHQIVMGYELVTPPLPMPRMESLVYPLMQSLVRFGDFTSQRSSVHFHIGFANNLRIMKNLLRICLELDPVLFRLGGVGGTFRGKINNAAYARPLLNSAAVKYISREMMMRDRKKMEYVRVINPMAALEASSLEEFWAAFSVKYGQGGGSGKYHPSRYSGINFYAIPQHGTIEFRHMNQTHDALIIVTTAQLLRGVVELSTILSKSEMQGFDIINPNIEISIGDGQQILYKLYHMCAEREIENLPSENAMASLMEVFAESHYTEIPQEPVITHVREEFVLSEELFRLGKHSVVEKVLPPHFVDIHNIGYISIFDDEKVEEVGEGYATGNSEEEPGEPPVFDDEEFYNEDN